MKAYVVMLVLLVAVPAAVLYLPVQGALAAPDAATGTITGTVENFTGGRRPVAGIDVKLTAYVNGAEADWKTSTTDARGRFTFTVPAAADRTYVANIKYKGGDYDSEPQRFAAGETRKQVAMRLYEPTTDAGVLRVNVHHVIIEVGDGMIQVAELMVFTNPTDRTYVGAVERADGKRETLRLSIPAGVGDVQYLEGLMDCCVFKTEDGLVDTMDVKPGMREIAYSYLVPARRGAAAVIRRLDYPTERVEVFGNAAAHMTAEPLAAMPAVQTDQGTYARFSAASLAAGTAVTVNLTGLPQRGTSTRRVAAAAFAGIIAAALAYPLLRRRPGAKGLRETRQGQPAGTRDSLIAAVAALDDRFDAGGLAEAEYHRLRARYLVKLQRMTEPDEDEV